jgi:hypothetical protein
MHAYPAPSIRIGTSIQEQLNDFDIALRSGDDKNRHSLQSDEGMFSKLRETDTV